MSPCGPEQPEILPSLAEMATSFTTLDATSIFLRRMFVRYPDGTFIPNQYVLVTDGQGNGTWGSVSSIIPIGFTTITDVNGTVLNAADTGYNMRVSTVGLCGLAGLYVEPATSSLVFSNAAPPVVVATAPVPAVTTLAAQIMPSPEVLQMSTTQSSLKFLGVGDILLSTVTEQRAMFISISSFTSAGYADLSAEARAWRPYVYSTNSTSAGYATFVSSIPVSTAYWDWSARLGSALPLSTVEAYPNYTTGDVYFSTMYFTMEPYERYIQPNSTTKMLLEITPSYMFPRMFLGSNQPLNLVKEFSTFVKYSPAPDISGGTTPYIMPTTVQGSWMLSQQSNAYTSNVYNTPFQLELDTAAIQSNILMDGPRGRYTVYHRIPGAMAELMNDGYCDYMLGGRGGFSNATPTYHNYTGRANTTFLHVYNQQGAAPPLPGP